MLLDANAKIAVQGITGREAGMMVQDMLAYGSNIVAGVTPGKGGQEVHGVPVYNTMAELVARHGATVSVVSVPPPAVLDASLEAIGNQIELCLIMTERVPRLDISKLLAAAKEIGCAVIGPNSLGLIRPGIAKLGTIGGRLDNVERSFMPGRVAVLSRSGGMTTEIASFLTTRGIGQSIAVGVGGDPIIGADFTELIELLEEDPTTDAVVLYAEPGGTAEERLAERLKAKPSRLRINAFFGGSFVEEMEGIRFGHAAVMVEQGRGSVRSKTAALRDADVFVADEFQQIIEGLNP
jgi:succinyl-CoA synthetase alpha subunit